MSLIDEALKRARQEAARQDAAQRYAYPATPAQVPARDRSRKALLTGLAAGLLIGALAIGGTLLVTRSRLGEEVAAAPSPAAETAAPLPVSIEELGTAAPGAEAAPAPPAEIPALASPAPAPVPVPTPAPPARVEVPAIEIQPRPAAPTAAAPTPAAPSVAAPPPVAPAPVEPQAAPPASAPPVGIAAPPPPPLVVPVPDSESPEAAPAPTHTAPPAKPPPAAEPEPGLDGRTFVRELPVPGGGRLELRGIASGSQPAALINGRVIGQGEVIEGFTVVGVDSRRVQLRGYGATVYLSLDPEQ